MSGYTQGTKVEWDWGSGTATGAVEKVYTRKITRKLKGTEVTRNGSDDDPALYIKQAGGGGVLKLSSELRKA